MDFLDLRTLLFSYTISNLICTFVLFTLWKQNRARFSGMGFWLTDYVLNFIGMMLLSLRGVVPDFLSVTVGNGLIICGTLFLFVGLERFLGKRGPQNHNIILLVVYFISHTYFVYVFPSLKIRNIIVTATILALCFQMIWLMLRRVDSKTLTITRDIGYIGIAICLIGIFRIILDLVVPPGNELFHANIYEQLLYLAFQMIYIVLTFWLFLLVNRRLFVDLEDDIVIRKQVEAALRSSEEKYSMAFQSSPDAIVISRLRDGCIIEVNDGFCNLTGYSRDETISNDSIALGLWANPEDREKIVTQLHAFTSVRDYEYDVRIKSGKTFRAQYSGEIINIGDEICMLSIIRDISERNRAEAIVRLRLMLWEFSHEHSPPELMQKALDEIETLTGSMISFYHFVDKDAKTLILQAWSTRTRTEFCHAGREGMHYSIDEAGVWVDCVYQKRPIIHNNFASLPNRKGFPEGHTEVIRELIVPILRDNQVVSILGVGNKPSDYDEKDVEIVAYIADVLWTIVSQMRANEQIHRLNGQLEYLAMTDELTVLINRRSFFIKGNEEISRARRYHTALTMIMLDIDKFKKINDTYGHGVGDMILQFIAKILQELCREVDVVARLGGEEFGILLPNTKAADGVILAERLRQAINGKNYLTQDQRISVSASFGVAQYSKEMQNLDELIKIADAAMYQAKNQGRNRVILSS